MSTSSISPGNQSSLIPSGTTSTGVQQTALSFKNILEVKSLGRNNENDKERYWIKVEFENGQTAAFQTESKSLTTAFEMIEAIGRQVNGLDSKDYEAYVKTNQGKRMWFDMTNVSKDPNSNIDKVTAYKRTRHGNSLKYAFTTKKNKDFTKNFTPTLTINNSVIADLKTLAKLWQTQLDGSVNLNHRDLRVVLKRKHD